MIWQHSNQQGEALNFVLAEAGSSIVGILGFISFRSFDPSLANDTIALAIWKRTDQADRGTGLQMLTWLMDQKKPRSVIAVGANRATLPIYKSLGFTTGSMSHFALFRQDLEMSTITGQRIRPSQKLGAGLNLLTQENELSENTMRSVEGFLSSNQPAKSARYYQHRFQKHPRFNYQFVTLGRHSYAELLVVFRTIEVEGAVVIRVVDIAGDLKQIPFAANALAEVVSQVGAEYLDILAYGIDEVAMVSNGFQSPETDPDLMIPNYFDPFERTNVDVLLAYTSNHTDSDSFHLHPADSDQDRPNR